MTLPETHDKAIEESLYTQATLLVPTESLESYKSAKTWKEFFNISGISTAINSIEADGAEGKEPIYDLRGVRLKEAKKGIYIKGGKKVVK